MSLKIYGTILQTQQFVKLKFTSTIINNLDGYNVPYWKTEQRLVFG